MKTSLRNHNEVAHVWAQQTQDEGHAGNMFFVKKIIYSYGHHFPIARFVGDNIVLFTTQDYSLSTSKHKSIVQSAIRHKQVIYCNDVESDFSDAREKNVSLMIENISDLEVKYARSRKYKDFLRREIISAMKNCNDYCDLIKIKKPFDLSNIDIVTLFEQASIARKKIDAITKKKNMAELKKWMDGKQSNVRFTSLPCKLRIKGERVETSWYADVPTSDFQLCYKLLKRGDVDKLIGCKISYYTINSITDKEVKVGCHTIAMKEIDRIGKMLDV